MRGESPDISSLIQAAGSSEAVIQHLLKEKASQAAQNTQLWRLVDKQRAMILGLNKDLERALKDKERYRKKMKDTVAAMAGADGSTKENTSSSSQQPRTQGVGAQIAAGMRDLHDEDHLPRQSGGNSDPARIVTSPGESSRGHTASDSLDTISSPASSYAPSSFSPDARKGFQERQQQRKEAAAIKMANSSPARESESRQSESTAPGSPPSLNVTEASPTQHKIAQPPRKAPPAPLNLNKKAETSSHLRQTNEGEDNDSEDDEDLEVDEIPAFSTERGRRATREEDDREREVAAMRDAESRSLSKKSKSKSAAAPIPEEPVPALKHAVQISPPERNQTRLNATEAATGSLAGMLAAPTNAPETRTETVKRTVLMPPPMSPGLPASPRPVQAMNSPFPRTTNMTLAPSNVASPPLSARMGQFPAMPLSPRAPRQPIPLPPNTPMSGSISMASPSMQKSQKPPQLQPPKPYQISKLSEQAESPQESRSPTGWSVSTEPGEIYRGFITEDYPDLLLPPNALPLIDIKVASSRLKPSRASMMFPNKMDEDPVFTLAIFSRNEGQELWRVEKDSLSLNWLDQDLKRHKTFADLKTPDKSLFSGHAPAKIDARRVALDKYLDDVLNTPMNTKCALLLCVYLSANTIEPQVKVSRPADAESPTKIGPDGKPFKHGYLTKRGKNFGGWKARYFVLDGPVLKYFESPPPAGAHLGAIKLQHSKIGKQQQQAQDSAEDLDNQYRHAFLILEPKRKDSSSLVRHVLCAESDQERDEWVEALVQYMEVTDSDDTASMNSEKLGRNDSSSSRTTTTSNKKGKFQKEQTIAEQDDDLRAMPYDATVPGQAPRLVKQRPADSSTPSPSMNGNDHDSQRSRENGTPSPPMTSHQQDGQMPHSEPAKSISGPQSMTKIEDSATWGQKPGAQQPVPEDKKNQKKRSFFGFGGNKQRPSSESTDHMEISNLSQMSFEQHGPIRAVFGAPLIEAVKYNHPVDVDIELPAVVYRCIEYLEEKNAVSEEGIFRLSGSNVVIKALRERFNVEGDVNLITDGQYYDMHAVASLLKLYLRELPTTILTRELHLDFLGVTEILDVHDKVKALCRLVHKLPKANNTLLRHLSNFLINVITNSDVNKMTVRNVGIVFSPTLNIPAPVLALFLQQYEAIFEAEPTEEEEGKTSVEVTVTAPLEPDDIRSPRRQQFQDLPTPSYNQTSFPQQQAATPERMQGQPNKSAYDTGFIPVHPSYEQNYGQPEGQDQQMGSMNAALSGAGPSYDQFPTPNGAVKQFGGSLSAVPGAKSKRRESSMFGMLGGGGKTVGKDREREEKRKSSWDEAMLARR